MNNGRRALAVLGVAAAIGFAGCGGDDEEEPAEGASGASGAAGVSGDFVTEANAICAEGSAAQDEAATEAFGQQQPSPEELEEFAADTLIPSVSEQIEQVSELTPPEGEEAAFEEFIASAEEDLAAVEEDPSLVVQDGGQNPFAETNALATELGLTECAS